MKKGWERKTIGEVCSLVKRGIAPKYVEVGGTRVVNQKCVRDHTINFELARRNDSSKKRIPEERLIQVGDVLVNSTGTGTLGRVAQVKTPPAEPTSVDTHVTIVRPIEGKFFSDFFGYMMIVIENELKEAGAGCGGQTELARKVLEEEFDVSYPLGHSEQEEIVEVLDKAFAAIDQAKANIEQNIANAKELFQSKLNQIFSQKGEGWVEKTLETICGFQNGFAFKSSKFRDEGIPILRISNIQNDQIDLRKIVYTNPDDYKENLERYKIVKGDLMIAMSGATTGKIGINKTDTEYLLNQRVGKFSPTADLNKRFLYYFLLTKAEENLRISAGAAQPNLSTSQIKSFQIPLPSLELQENAVLRLDTIQAQSRALQSHYQTKLASLDELKKSILQKAFAGELT